MHIVLLNDDAPNAPTSVSTIMRNLLKGYEAAGHTITVVCSHRKEENSQIQRYDNVISLPISYRQSLRQYLCLYMPSVNRMLHKEFAQLQPDIVHAHNIHGYITYNALRIANKYAKHVCITMHDVMSFSYARLRTKQFLDSQGKDCSLSLADHLREAELQYNPLRNSSIRSTIHKHIAKVICPSAALEHALHTHGMSNTMVIPNGIDLDEWDVPQEAVTAFAKKHNLTDKKVILFGGRLSIDKGAVPLLNVLDRLREQIPNVLLFVAGDPKRWEGLLRAANATESLAKHIYNPGWMDRKDIILANLAADVITTPSLCLDVFPSTNLEGMAAGKPVVGTCFGGTPEVVDHEKTGIVLDPRNEDELHEVLQALLSEEEVSREMGEAGRKRIEEHFTTTQQTQKHLDLFASLKA